jgi:hypothetical protein
MMMKEIHAEATMIPRIASILQIALLIGCPCWCKSGLCAAHASCCNPREEVAVTPDACCGERHTCCAEQAEPAESSRPSEPERSPSEPVAPAGKCQCICGGAVLGEPISSPGFDELSTLFCPFCPIALEAAPPSLTDHFSVGAACGPSSSGACSGRELRTLIASLLC